MNFITHIRNMLFGEPSIAKALAAKYGKLHLS